MREVELQALVTGLARWANFLVYHTVDSRKSRPGFPDLVMVHRVTGRMVIAELKAEKGRVSEAQQEWLDVLGKAHEVYLWRPADWESGAIQRVLSQQAVAA